MDCKNVFKLDLNLEKLSLTSAATMLWSLPDVQDKVNNYFRENELPSRSDNRSLKWDKVIDYVVGYGSLVRLPNLLLCKLRNFVALIGEKIYNWRAHVQLRYGLDVKHIEKVYWTSCGTIDDLKIVEECWLKESNLSAENYEGYIDTPLLNLAVLYAREDFFKGKPHETISSKLNLYLGDRYNISNWKIYGILSAWQILLTSQTKRHALERFLNFDEEPNYLPAKALFLNSVKYNFRFAAKFFWGKLKTCVKKTFIVEAAEKCLKSIRRYYGFIPEHRIEILIFLLNQMSPSQITEFVEKKLIALIKLFIRVSPYQEVCVKILEQNWAYHQNDIKKLLKFIMKYLSCTRERMELRDKNLYRTLFEILLQRTSKEVKLNYFVNKNSDQFYEIFKNFNPISFVFILNDVDLKEYRDRILSNCEDIFKMLVFEEQYEVLNIIMDNALSDEEKISFKNKLNFLHFFITNGQYELGDRHLSWLCDAENDRLAAKEEIYPLEICGDLIEGYKFDLAEKFLLWRFDTAEDREMVKEHVNEFDESHWDEIYQIRTTDEPIFLSKEALKLDKAIKEFKKTEIVEFFILKHWQKLYDNNLFADIGQFLKSCSWTDEEVEECRRTVANNINWWIDTFILHEMKMLDTILDWIFDDTSLKREMIANYLTSTKGAFICINLFKNLLGFRGIIADFFNFWFDKSVIDSIIQEMRKTLDSFDETVSPKKVDSLIVNLLNLRKNGKMIVASDLPENMGDFECNDESDNRSNYTLSDISDDDDDYDEEEEDDSEDEY